MLVSGAASHQLLYIAELVETKKKFPDPCSFLLPLLASPCTLYTGDPLERFACMAEAKEKPAAASTGSAQRHGVTDG